jgi:alpha-L-rhamnosidase
VTWCNAWLRAIRGDIVSDWKIENGTFFLDATIPANSTAEVWLPAVAPLVTESGLPAGASDGVKLLRSKDGCAIFEVGGGTYRFAGPMAK